MDLIYPYHNDKRTGELCLKYSLRSVEMHFGQAIDNVYIVGDKTDFKNVIHITVTDYMSQARNIWAKILMGALNLDISEKFMVMSDDHFITKPQPDSHYPVCANGTLEELCISQGNSYKVILQNTIKLLREKGKPTINYNIHCPAVFNKNKVIELHEAYPLSDGNIGFVTKSLYFNHFGIKPDVQIKDSKIRQNYSHEEIEGKIGSRDCFSTGKEDVCPNIVSYLDKKYPNKSKYEI